MQSSMIRFITPLLALEMLAFPSGCVVEEDMTLLDRDATEGDVEVDEPPGPAAIGGRIGRAESAMLWPGNDGVGTLYVAAFAGACEGDLAGNTRITGADLSDIGNSVEYTIAGLPPGTYFIGGFLDENGASDPDDPAPRQGDLVLAEGTGPGCIEVVLAGEDVDDADFLLNVAIPF